MDELLALKSAIDEAVLLKQETVPSLKLAGNQMSQIIAAIAYDNGGVIEISEEAWKLCVCGQTEFVPYSMGAGDKETGTTEISVDFALLQDTKDADD